MCRQIVAAAVEAPSKTKPSIIFLHTKTNYSGGMENHIVEAAKTFHNYGHDVLFITGSKTPAERLAQDAHIPCLGFDQIDNESHLYTFLTKICSSEFPDIIMSIKEAQLNAVKRLQQNGSKVKSVFKQHHSMSQCGKKIARNELSCDGIITLNPHQLKVVESLDIPTASIPSFFKDDAFKNTIITASPKETLENFFGIKNDGSVIFCMVANFYGPKRDPVKNHPLMIKALQKLKHEYQDKFLCIFAGGGSDLDRIKQMAKKLNVDDCTLFLGYTNHVPELLHGCDFHVLASKHEPFGIATAEAGLMGRASIGATGTGAEIIIKDGATGLIFINDNADDLAEKIHILIKDKNLRTSMGVAARTHVLETLTNEAKYCSHMNFFKKLGVC